MSFYIPFNHNPASRDIKTAPYTIPAGQYAFVHFLAYDTDCTIDADVVIPALSVSDVQTLSASNTNIYAPTTGYNFKGFVSFNETNPGGAQTIRFGLRVSATDYYHFALNFPTSTSSTLIDILGDSDNATETAIDANKSVGIRPLYVPSGATVNFNLLTGSCSTRVHIFGEQIAPMGVQTVFRVPSGLQVDGTKFEVTLFNLV